MIGECIRSIRESLGLTQTQFAEKLGMTSPAISQIESGKRKPAYDTIKKMIEVFNLNPKVLFLNKKRKR
jgi:transcriptional regulator with XRE-family HTH domain